MNNAPWGRTDGASAIIDAPYENIGGHDVSVDARGEYICIGSRHGLLIIDIQAPFQPVKRLSKGQSKASSQTVVQWHTSISHRDYLASSTNKNVLIWNLEAGVQPLEATLQCHSRVISDFAWAPMSPTSIASSDIGGEMHLWDTRSIAKPTQTFHCATGGMSQLEWNRFDEFLLASIHDNVLNLWDTRKSASHLFSTTASGQQLYGMDWCQTSRHELLTCGKDKIVRFWNVVGSPSEHSVGGAPGGELEMGLGLGLGKGMSTGVGTGVDMSMGVNTSVNMSENVGMGPERRQELSYNMGGGTSFALAGTGGDFGGAGGSAGLIVTSTASMLASRDS
jgi:WD40 repeat protein